jgi:hypothetical protein
MRADRIFFVADDPVVVFSALPSNADEEQIIMAYRRAWSMGRARCPSLTLALPASSALIATGAWSNVVRRLGLAGLRPPRRPPLVRRARWQMQIAGPALRCPARVTVFLAEGFVLVT